MSSLFQTDGPLTDWASVGQSGPDPAASRHVMRKHDDTLVHEHQRMTVVMSYYGQLRSAVQFVKHTDAHAQRHVDTFGQVCMRVHARMSYYAKIIVCLGGDSFNAPTRASLLLALADVRMPLSYGDDVALPDVVAPSGLSPGRMTQAIMQRSRQEREASDPLECACA